MQVNGEPRILNDHGDILTDTRALQLLAIANHDAQRSGITSGEAQL